MRAKTGPGRKEWSPVGYAWRSDKGEGGIVIVVPSCADAYRRSIPPSRPVLNASMATFHSTCRRSRTSSSKSWGERDVKVYRDIEYSLVQILDLALCRRECIFDRDHDVLVFSRNAQWAPARAKPVRPLDPR